MSLAQGLKVLVGLIFLGVVADIADCIYYLQFARSRGGPSWEVLGEYLSTPWGALLSVLALGPWLSVLIWVFLSERPKEEEGP